MIIDGISDIKVMVAAGFTICLITMFIYVLIKDLNKPEDKK